MEKNEICLLNRMYQDATIGMLAIDKIVKKGDIVLVKASRGMKLEKIVEYLNK